MISFYLPLVCDKGYDTISQIMDYIVSMTLTHNVMCKKCCVYPSHTCVCPSVPVQPVNALVICANQSLLHKRLGIVRDMVVDAKNAVTNLMLRGWFSLGNAILVMEDRIATIFKSRSDR